MISPVLCNVYLHRLDRQWAERGHGVLVRYADDLLAMCKTRQEAERALVALTAILAELGLGSRRPRRGSCTCGREARGWTSSASITAGCAAEPPGHSIVAFLARWPSRQAMQHARDRVRELTAGDRLRWPIEQVVGDLNRFLRGWAGYFRYGNSTVQFDHDHPPRGSAPRAVDRQPPSSSHGATAGRQSHRPAGPLRTDQPQRNHRRAPTQPTVAPGS